MSNDNVFSKYLKNIGLDENRYLKAVKLTASKKGYDADKIFLSRDKPEKKLYYLNNNKKIYFGQTNYNDFIIYKFREFKGEDFNALEKQKLYHSRAEIVAKKTKNKFSPANLSLNILW